MTQRIHVLTYEHRHGKDTFAFGTLLEALEARSEIIVNNVDDEVTDVHVNRAIKEAYETDDHALCHSLYTTEVEGESLEIEDCELRGVETKRPFIVVDSNTDIAHRVVTWPFGENTGKLMCEMEFLWQCPRTTEVACFMHLPKEPPVLSCLQCIAKETK